MLKSIVAAKKVFLEGILKEINISPDLKNIHFTMLPFSIDVEKFTQAVITAQNPLFFSIKGLSYQAEIFSKQSQITHEMFGWGEIDDSRLLEDFFSGKLTTSDPQLSLHGDAYGDPRKYQALRKQFHHLYFEGFDAYIDILCRDVAIEIKKS